MSVPALTELRYDAVDEYLHDLSCAWGQDGAESIELDWQNLGTIEPPAGFVLANGLLGSLRPMPLVIKLPRSDDCLNGLSRYGLSFALAQRDQDSTKILPDPELLDLDRWTRSWTLAVAGDQQDEPLFDEGGSGAEGARSYAAFVNPHLARPTYGQTNVSQVVRPWLIRTLSKSRRLSTLLRSLVTDVGVLLDELIENVREHAAASSDGVPTVSLVRVAVRKGPQCQIHVTVQDTGKGIARTVREKLGDTGAPEDDATLIEALVRRQLALVSPARGFGLPEIYRMTRARRGTLRIRTQRARVVVDGQVEAVGAPFDLQGTVISVMIPAPRPDRVSGLVR